ncbi:hypothetical protein H9I52_09085 [Hymenobacter sp. BT491]|nr:hypothetical protein [Hymenobacter sp. BT491]
MNPPKSIGLLRKFVSTARSVTTGQVSLPLGIMRLERNLYWLAQYDIRPLSDEELKTVNAYCSRIKEFPIEQERTYWEPNTLQSLDEKLERITAKYQPRLLSILVRIVTETA